MTIAGRRRQQRRGPGRVTHCAGLPGGRGPAVHSPQARGGRDVLAVAPLLLGGRGGTRSQAVRFGDKPGKGALHPKGRGCCRPAPGPAPKTGFHLRTAAHGPRPTALPRMCAGRPGSRAAADGFSDPVCRSSSALSTSVRPGGRRAWRGQRRGTGSSAIAPSLGCGDVEGEARRQGGRQEDSAGPTLPLHRASRALGPAAP